MQGKVKIGKPKRGKYGGDQTNMSGLPQPNEVLNSMGLRTVPNMGSKKKPVKKSVKKVVKKAVKKKMVNRKK